MKFLQIGFHAALQTELGQPCILQFSPAALPDSPSISPVPCKSPPSDVCVCCFVSLAFFAFHYTYHWPEIWKHTEKMVSFPWKCFEPKSLCSMYVGKKARGMESKLLQTLQILPSQRPSALSSGDSCGCVDGWSLHTYWQQSHFHANTRLYHQGVTETRSAPTHCAVVSHCLATAGGILPWHCYFLLDRWVAKVVYFFSAVIPLWSTMWLYVRSRTP